MSEPEQDYKPVELTDKFMEEMFSRVEEHKDFRPFKAEVDQFFQSRIWCIVEEEARRTMAGLYRQMGQPGVKPEQRDELAAAIRVFSWWMNARDNIFAARQRATGADARTVGGESWQEQHPPAH